ncbi:MAG: YhcH/YjgK/YiaL family protein [Clostridia bacterium]|nr:YhcH/YjgK/YiaL family protein [Clostridia bacterium]
MIFDNIRNCDRYIGLHPDLKAVFERLSAMTASSEAGRYEISDRAYVNHMTITTRPAEESRFEGHALYADLQYVVSGTEEIDVFDGEGKPLAEDRLSSGDICFYEPQREFQRFVLKEGDFILVFPGEAHRPAVAPDGWPSETIKSVGKLRMK